MGYSQSYHAAILDLVAKTKESREKGDAERSLKKSRTAGSNAPSNIIWRWSLANQRFVGKEGGSGEWYNAEQWANHWYNIQNGASTASSGSAEQQGVNPSPSAPSPAATSTTDHADENDFPAVALDCQGYYEEENYDDNVPDYGANESGAPVDLVQEAADGNFVAWLLGGARTTSEF